MPFSFNTVVIFSEYRGFPFLLNSRAVRSAIANEMGVGGYEVGACDGRGDPSPTDRGCLFM